MNQLRTQPACLNQQSPLFVHRTLAVKMTSHMQGIISQAYPQLRGVELIFSKSEMPLNGVQRGYFSFLRGVYFR